jgi:hypothetical protein
MFDHTDFNAEFFIKFFIVLFLFNKITQFSDETESM